MAKFVSRLFSVSLEFLILIDDLFANSENCPTGGITNQNRLGLQSLELVDRLTTGHLRQNSVASGSDLFSVIMGDLE